MSRVAICLFNEMRARKAVFDGLEDDYKKKIEGNFTTNRIAYPISVERKV